MRHLTPLLIALAVSASCTSAPSERPPEQAVPPAAAEGDVITTELQPGWNMVGWLGPRTPVSELFDLVPELVRVSVWVAGREQYAQTTRSNRANGRAPDLTPGRGLWIYIGGTEPVEWTRPVASDPAAVFLREGRNLVGWTGHAGTQVGQALAGVKPVLRRAVRWDAVNQAFEHHHPRAGDTATTFRELRHGDAFWVEVTEDAWWWQSGAVSSPFVFTDDVPADARAHVRAETASVLSFFADQYGIVPPEVVVSVDPEVTAAASSDGRRIVLRGSTRAGPSIGSLLAREYVHVVQRGWAGDQPVPAWLTAGTAGYASGLYEVAQHETTVAQLLADRRGLVRKSSPPPLRDMEDTEAYREAGPAAGGLSSWAVGWLEERAVQRPGGPRSPNTPAFISFYRFFGDSGEWRQSFEAAFGVSVDSFYTRFAAERARPEQHPTHATDDRLEPVIVFLGDIPPDTEAAARADVRAAQAFFAEHFEAEPADYTVYLAADWPSGAGVYTALIDHGEICGHLYNTNIAFITLPCPTMLRSHLGWFHFRNVQERIDQRARRWLPGPDRLHPQGPDWLHMGAQSYAQYAYLRSLDPEAARALRDRHTRNASRSGERLSGMETISIGTWGPSRWASRGFFAVEWLAEHVGAPALLDYYRLVASAPSWRVAFEQAFGMTVADFYAAAEPHIDGIVVLIPHLADDRDEPVLVLLGDISPDEEAEVRADFETAQTFFGERLGAPAADYTVYVGADQEAALPAYRKSFGQDPGPRFCFTASQGSALVITLDCAILAEYLGRYHYINILGVIRIDAGYDYIGPLWLRAAIEAYARYTYQMVARPDAAARLRVGLAQRAHTVTPPLTDLETHGSSTPEPQFMAALGYFIGELLVEGAGELALLDYFRQRSETEPWEDTFEAVFGITARDFYEAFAAYRVDFAHPDQ